MRHNSKKVYVGLSGGVDSSVAAYLLQKAGYDVTGVFMRCYNLDGCSEKDAEDARRVAGHLEIPFYVWDFEEDYKKRVMEYMVDGYRNGITPNPDVMCNKEIKFGLFLDKALEFGADYVATGHYIRIVQDVVNDRNVRDVRIQQAKRSNKRSDPTFQLFAARDSNKDQSYFLWTLTQDKLKHCLFPVGDYLKSEVRVIAKKAGLPTAEKKDSQGICFLGQVKLDDFLSQYIEPCVGQVRLVRSDGTYETVGEHAGAQFYTIGQRQGIGNLKHQKGVTAHKPLYISDKDIKTNTIIVAEGSENEALYHKEIELTDINFINSQPNSPIRANWRMEVLARVRYRQPLALATLIFTNSIQANAKNIPRRSTTTSKNQRNSVLLVFEQKQKFIAPGQSAVFYADDGRMIGGGVII